MVPELLGLNCRPEAIAAAVRQLLESEEARRTMEEGYQEIRNHLGAKLPSDANGRTVEILEEMLRESPGRGVVAPGNPPLAGLPS